MVKNTIETETKSIQLIHIYMTSHLPRLVQTLQYSGRVKLLLWAQTDSLSEMMLSWKCFLQTNKCFIVNQDAHNEQYNQ